MTKRTAKRRAAPKKPAPKVLSRKLLNALLSDLHDRLARRVDTAEAIAIAALPDGATMTGAVPMLTVLSTALESHVCDLRQIRAFAQIICERGGAHPAVMSLEGRAVLARDRIRGRRA